MTLDDLPFDYPSPPTPTGARGRRTCRKHQWHWAGEMPEDGERCASCGKVRDLIAARRGKTARNRGNAFEREVAAKLGGRRVGQYGDQTDVDIPGWMKVQCKNGASFPERIDRWLRAIPVPAGTLRAVVLGDAPGPGRRRRSLIVLDLDEFAEWYGGRPDDAE